MRGYRLGLVSLQQALDLPLPDDQLAQAGAQVAADHAAYQLQSWVGAVPEKYAEALAELIALISIEAPTGELVREAGSADVADLRDSERTLAAQGRTKYTTIATDAAGVVSGYTELVASQHVADRAFQWDTLVRSADRGHRLGLAMKIANLRLLQVERPQITKVITYNAEVNRPMIAVNETLGFRAVEFLGEFQKRAESPATSAG